MPPTVYAPAVPPTEPPWPEVVSLAVHEMRSPLNVVSGFLDLLLGGHGGPLTPAQRQAIEAAGSAAARVSDLLAALGELARLESGRLVPAEDRVPVAELIRAAAARFVSPLDQPIRCLVADDIPDTHVVVDHQRMVRALASMAAYVSHSTPTSPAVILGAAIHGPDVAITFTSVTASMSPADLDDLAPLPETHGGVGLGLPLARFLIAQAGGRAGVPRAGTAAGQLAALLPLR